MDGPDGSRRYNMASDKVLNNGLNLQQERFCQLYVSKEFFAHGTESYSEAYGIKLDAESYNTCKTNASRLLLNADILARINELLDLSGMNDEFIDKQLTFVATQNADLNAKMKAIDSYNKLKARITEKLDIKTNGVDLSKLSLDTIMAIKKDLGEV